MELNEKRVAALEKSIADLADALKNLTSLAERMEAVEKQLKDAQQIDAQFRKAQLPFGMEGLQPVGAGREFLFRGINPEKTTRAEARKILEKSLLAPNKDDELIKEWHTWCDTIKIYSGLTGKEPHQLNCYKDFVAWVEKAGLKDVLSIAGAPTNWVPETWSAEILMYYQQELLVPTIFDEFEMPSDPFRWDFIGTGFTLYLRGEPTAEPASKIKSSKPADAVITFTTKELAGRLPLTDKLTEDALAAYVPTLRQELIPRSMAEAEETADVNGDDSATSFDTLTLASDDVRRAWKGIRYWANANTTVYDVTTGSTSFLYSDFGEVMLRAGKYAVRVPEGVWVMSNKAYIRSLSMAQVETMEKINLPTNMNGVVNQIYGRPVIVSPEYPETLNSSGIDTGAGTAGGFTYVNRRQFRKGYRRAYRIEYDRDIETGLNVIVCSMRKTLQLMVSTSETICASGSNVT